MSLALIGWLCLVQGVPPVPEVAARKDEVVSALINALADNESFVRNAAASALGEIGPAAAKAIPGLAEAIREPDGSLATASLGKLGPAALPAIIQLMKHEEIEVRKRAAFALCEMGPAAKPALPVLWPLVREGDADVQDYAGFAIEAIAPAARVELTAALEDGSPAVRVYAAHGLPKADPADRLAQRIARQALTDANARVRARAIDSLGLARLNGEPDSAAIRVGLTDSDPLVRGFTIELFAKDPFRSPDAVPALAGALSDEDERVRYTADRARSHYGPEAAAAIPALIKRVTDDVAGKHFEAVVALGKIGRDDPRVAAILLKWAPARCRPYRSSSGSLRTRMSNPRIARLLSSLLDTSEPPVRWEKSPGNCPVRRFLCCAVSSVAPKGQPQNSPGQRPGKIGWPPVLCPVRAKQSLLTQTMRPSTRLLCGT
jgi:HEAT repeat protein